MCMAFLFLKFTIKKYKIMSEFTDYHNVIIKKGDKINLQIFGVGSGEAEIVEKDNELQIYESSQGYYPLKHALLRDDMRITVL